MARRRRIVDPNKPSAWPFIGMGAMAVLLFFYLYAAVIVPWWVLLGLLALYFVLFVEATRRWNDRPKSMMKLAAGGMATWLIVVVGGAIVFDWEPRWDPGPAGKIPEELNDGA